MLVAIRTPKEITDGYIEACGPKAQSPVWRLLVLSVLAGMLIGLGAVASSTASFDMPTVGVARLITGAIFPIGLIMVVLLGAELFTGNALMVTGAMSGQIKWTCVLRNWVVVYIGNFIGAIILAALMAFFGQLDLGGGSLAVKTAQIAAAKCQLPWLNAFVLAIFCNVLVCIAIYLGNTAHEVAGKILGVFFPAFGFVIASFEHCVANMYYIPAGIFAASIPQYADLLSRVSIDTSVLTVPTFLLGNLVPVTLGNIVGGALVGIIMYASHATKGKVA